MTLLEAVVEWHLFEVNLARLPEGLLALLLLTGKELCDVGVMALGNILVPTLLHLIILHVVHIFHLNKIFIRLITFLRVEPLCLDGCHDS